MFSAFSYMAERESQLNFLICLSPLYNIPSDFSLYVVTTPVKPPPLPNRISVMEVVLAILHIVQDTNKDAKTNSNNFFIAIKYGVLFLSVLLQNFHIVECYLRFTYYTKSYLACYYIYFFNFQCFFVIDTEDNGIACFFELKIEYLCFGVLYYVPVLTYYFAVFYFDKICISFFHDKAHMVFTVKIVKHNAKI